MLKLVLFGFAFFCKYETSGGIDCQNLVVFLEFINVSLTHFGQKQWFLKNFLCVLQLIEITQGIYHSQYSFALIRE